MTLSSFKEPHFPRQEPQLIYTYGRYGINRSQEKLRGGGRTQRWKCKYIELVTLLIVRASKQGIFVVVV